MRCHWFCCRCRRRLGRRIEFRQHGINLILAIGHRCWRWHGRFWRSRCRRCLFRWRRRRNRTGWSSSCHRLLRWRGGFGRLGRLGCIVVGNDASDGGKDFLHRRLLRLRRLRHSLKIPTHSLRSTPRQAHASPTRIVVAYRLYARRARVWQMESRGRAMNCGPRDSEMTA